MQTHEKSEKRTQFGVGTVLLCVTFFALGIGADRCFRTFDRSDAYGQLMGTLNECDQKIDVLAAERTQIIQGLLGPSSPQSDSPMMRAMNQGLARVRDIDFQISLLKTDRSNMLAALQAEFGTGQ